MAATLEQLLANRNTWSQSINLEVFNGHKDIFRDNVPLEKGRRVYFPLTTGVEIPVALYEFELHASFQEATGISGCKWWRRKSQPSRAVVNYSRSLHTMSFSCRHYEQKYTKQEVDNSRTSRHILRCGCTAACTMKAISVRTFMRSEGMYLISFKVDQTNRGHGHLVVCSSTKSVQEGKLCESEDDGRDDRDENGEDHSASFSRKPTRKSSEEIQLKAKRDARMKEIQDHFYRVKAKLESCKMADFWEKADEVDGDILTAFRRLGGVPDVAQTAVAHRYSSDPRRHKRPAGEGLRRTNKVAAAAVIAGGSANTPAAAGKQGYAVIHISDSEELEVFEEELRDGGGSSSD